jgi:hypothetical protein
MNKGDNIYTAPEQPLNPPKLQDDVTQAQVDNIVRHYDNSDFAQALIENDPVNEYAREIIASVLDFSDLLIGINFVHIGEARLDLKLIRLMAVRSAEIQAYETIEKDNLK